MSLRIFVVLWIVALCTKNTCAFWGRQRHNDDVKPRYQVVPYDIHTKGKEQHIDLKRLSEEETLVQKLFGTDCYTAVLHKVNSDCKRLTQDAKYRLAVQFANCHLQHLGEPGHVCPDKMELSRCAAQWDDRFYRTQLEFYTNIDSMCLFVQNQNFEQRTEHILGELYAGSQHAAQQLGQLQGLARDTGEELVSVGQRVGALGQLQQEVVDKVDSSVMQLARLSDSAESLEGKVSQSLENEVAVLSKQTLVLDNLEKMEAAERERAALADERWKAAEFAAQSIVEQQLLQLATQQKLASELSVISSSSEGLRTTMEMLLHYQQRSHSMLSMLLGRSYGVDDIMFYAASLAGVMGAGSCDATRRARLPLMSLLMLCAAVERSMGAWMAAWTAGEPTAQAVLCVKWYVRRAVLCCAVGLLLWSALTYRSLQRETRRLLDQIQEHMDSAEERWASVLKKHLSPEVHLPATFRQPSPLLYPRPTLHHPMAHPLDDPHAAAHLPGQLPGRFQGPPASSYHLRGASQLERYDDSWLQWEETDSGRDVFQGLPCSLGHADMRNGRQGIFGESGPQDHLQLGRSISPPAPADVDAPPPHRSAAHVRSRTPLPAGNTCSVTPLPAAPSAHACDGREALSAANESPAIAQRSTRGAAVSEKATGHARQPRSRRTDGCSKRREGDQADKDANSGVKRQKKQT